MNLIFVIKARKEPLSVTKNKFITPYSNSTLSVIVDADPKDSLTKPEFAHEADINRIMERYNRTGVLPDTARLAAAQYGDFSQVPNYLEMHEKIMHADALFAALPAKLRKEFNNDPHQFLKASGTPEGQALIKTLGLPTSAPINAGSVDDVNPPAQSAEGSKKDAKKASVPTDKVG